MSDATRRSRIVVETERHRIVGDVTLPTEGFQTRLSDLLNQEGRSFIPLVDVEVSGLNGEKPQRRPFIAVARDHVVVAYEPSE